MATVKMVEYDDAEGDVKQIFDEIMKLREIDFVPNVWKTLAVHPPTLRRLWDDLRKVMAPSFSTSLFKPSSGSSFCQRAPQRPWRCGCSTHMRTMPRTSHPYWR